MFLISSAVLLEFILLRSVESFVFGVMDGYFTFFFDENNIFYDFFSSMENEEFYALANNAASILILWISFIISCALLILFLRKVRTKADLDINNRVSFKFKMPENTIILLLFGLAIVYFCGFISIGFDGFIGLFGIQKRIYESFAFPKTALGIIIYFISLVVSPAILEEFFCRYLILNALRKYGDGLAITVSSVFFGLLHGRTSAFFFATAIGFLSAYLAIKTRSIWFPIILHAFINSMSMLWHFISDLSEAYNKEELYTLIYWSVMTVLFGVSMIYLIRLVKTRKDLSLKRRRDYIYINPGRKAAVFFNAATIIFIILAVARSTFEYFI
jgi:membrane protease YdiL (CAAX protease family)